MDTPIPQDFHFANNTPTNGQTTAIEPYSRRHRAAALRLTVNPNRDFYLCLGGGTNPLLMRAVVAELVSAVHATADQVLQARPKDFQYQDLLDFIAAGEHLKAVVDTLRMEVGCLIAAYEEKVYNQFNDEVVNRFKDAQHPVYADMAVSPCRQDGEDESSLSQD